MFLFLFLFVAYEEKNHFFKKHMMEHSSDINDWKMVVGHEYQVQKEVMNRRTYRKYWWGLGITVGIALLVVSCVVSFYIFIALVVWLLIFVIGDSYFNGKSGYEHKEEEAMEARRRMAKRRGEHSS